MHCNLSLHCLAIGISDCSLNRGVLSLLPEKGVQDSCVLVPGEGSAPRSQGSLLLTFPTLGNPPSTARHHGRVRCGSSRSHLRLSLPAPAVLLVTSRSSSLHHSFLQGCCGMERLMNKSIPLGAEAAKLGCEQRSSAGAGGLTAGVAPLVNSPHAAAADRAAAAKWAVLIAFSTCFIYQSAQYAALSRCPTFFFFFPRFSRLEMGAAVWRGAVGLCWLLLGWGSSGLISSLPWPVASPCLSHGCHSATTVPRRGVPCCERKDSDVRVAFPELREHFQGAATKAFGPRCVLCQEQRCPGQQVPGAAGGCCDASVAWQGLALTWPCGRCHWPILVPARFPPSPPAACARGGEEGAAGRVPAASLLINKPR